MSTSSPPPATPGAPDPSMEEILASIRRILTEEELPPAAEPPAPPTPPEDDVLVLDDSMMVPSDLPSVEPDPFDAALSPPGEPAAPGPEPIAEQPPPLAAIVPTETATPALAQEIEFRPDQLLAPAAAAAAASSVGSLVRTLTAGRATQVYSGGPTLEDIVRAELRPLLKEWLDSNLPPLVERLVRAEIERVVGRAVP